MKSAYKVNYQGLNPEIIEGLRDCCINDIDDSLIYVNDIDSIAVDYSNIDAIEEKEALEHDLMYRAQKFHMSINEYVYDTPNLFDAKIKENFEKYNEY